MNPSQQLLSIIDRTQTATTQEQIDSVQEDVDKFLAENENVFEIILGLFAEFKEKRIPILTYAGIFINKLFPTLPDESREQIIQQFFEICRDESLSTDDKKRLSSLLIKAFAYTENWNELFEAALTLDDVFCILLITDNMGEQVLPHIQEVIQKSFNCFQQTGFENIDSIVTIFLIGCDSEGCQEAFPQYLEIVQQAMGTIDNLDDNQKVSIWMLASILIAKGVIPPESVSDYIEIIKHEAESNVVTAIKALSELTNCVKAISDEDLDTLFDLSIQCCLEYMNENDGDLDTSGTDIIVEALQTKKVAESIIAKANELIQSEEPVQKALGIRILAKVMFNKGEALQSQYDEVKRIFIDTLTSEEEEPVVKAAVLWSLLDFEGATIEISSLISDLIKVILPYIECEDERIRSLSYQVLIKLIESNDTEIEGLFNDVWGFMENVEPADTVSYIHLVSNILETSEPDDDVIDALYEWIDSLTAEEQDITIRSAALTVIGTLMKQQNQVLDDLVEVARTICEIALQDSNDDIICDALSFLKITAQNFRQASIEIIQPYIPALIELIHGSNSLTRRVSEALITLSVYVGYADNTQQDVIDEAIICANKLLNDEDDTETLISGIYAAGRIAKALTPEEGQDEKNEHNATVLHQFFTRIIKIASESDEIDIVSNSLKNLKPIFKRGVMFDADSFTQESIEFITHLLNGEIQILEGIPAKDSEIISQIVEALMEFIGKVFKQGIDGTEISQVLLEWLNTTEDATCQFAITGALSDAIEYSQITDEIPSALCQFVFERAESLDDPDLEHNIVYFLALIIRKYPALVETIAPIKPVVERWWSKAIEKASGYQEFIANIVSLWLSFAAIDPSFSQELLAQSIARFPPADLEETQTQCELIAQIFSSPKSPDLVISAAIAISKLLTESQSKITQRHVSQECIASMQAFLKSIAATNGVTEALARQYANNKQKRAIIEAILSSE